MAAVTSAVSLPAAPGRIFFSCAPEDESETVRLAAALAKHDLPVIALPPSSQRNTPAWKERVPVEIRECDLFLPVISSHTETNLEGQFRTEWEQAAERATTKTDSLPFLVPLVLDNVPAENAKVPAAFRTVQWIPLPADDEEAALTARLQEMLRRHDALRLRRDRQVTPPLWVHEPETPAPAATPRRFSAVLWIAGALSLAALGVAGFFVLRPDQDSSPSQRVPNASASTATSATPSATAVPVARTPTLEASRIFLPSFVNLTGDVALDEVGHLVGTELTRAFARAAGFQVVPGNAADLPSAIEAARRAGAALVVTGSYTRTGAEIQLRTQITLAASGVSYGVLGPVVLDSTVSGPTLTNIMERMTTGVCEASDIVQDPPAQVSKMAYARPFARWPLAQQARALAALPLGNTERRIADARTILNADPGMVDVKLYLARAYRDAGRYNEASVLFAELFDERSLLSQSELFDLLYDRSLLLGNLETALSAAHDRSALRPRSDAINDVVSCLLALNRGRSAANELAAWLETTRASLPAAEVLRRENQAATLDVLAFVRQGETARAQSRLATWKTHLGAVTSLPALQLEALVLARAGSQADFDRLLDRVSELPSLSLLEPVRIAYNFHCLLLHAGRLQEAAHFLERAKNLWAALPPVAYSSTEADAILLQADLAFAQNRALDALAALDHASPQTVAAHALEFDGRRALALQDLGRTADFALLLAKLEGMDLRNSRGLPLYWRARLAARAGLQKGTIGLLHQAVAQGLWLDDLQQFASSYGRTEPEFAPLRGVPSYEEFLLHRG